MIKYYAPKDLKEALNILSERDCYLLSGGTDLMVHKHLSSGLLPNFDKDVMCLMNIKELDYIKADEQGIHVGATTRFSELEKSDLVTDIFKKVIKEIASPNIRNMATMSGNIANASPAGDSIVPLVITDSEVVLISKEKERKVKVQDFILGVKKIDLAKGEMIKEIIIKKPDLNYLYRKVGSRKAESITKVSALVAYKVENHILKDFRVAFGSVAIKTVRNQEIENKYIGKNINELEIDEIVKDYAPLVTPITDQRSNKEYRHKVAMNLLKKFVSDIKGGRYE